MSIRKLPDGRYEWRHRVGGRHLKKTFTRRADAVRHDAQVRADLERGTHVDTSDKTTVAEYFTAWVDGRVLRPSSVRARQALLRSHIAPSPLGGRPLVRVRPSEVQAWVKDLSGKVGPQTVSDYTSTLSAMFASAVEDGRIARNPVSLRRLTMPVISQPKLVPLTIPQVLQWAGAARPHVRAMILTQAGLGLRISELIALRKADVDFLRREVHITEQLDRSGKRAPLKTSRSRRDVPLPVVTSEVLARHIEQHPPGESGLIFTQVIEPYRADGAPNRNYLRQDLIREDFTWSSRTAARAYRKAAQAAGLPDTISSHDLRHHYASVLLDAGESVHAVAERLGDTAEMVLRIYGHVMPDREDTTRKAVDAAWQAAAEASPDAPDRRRLAAVSNLDDDLGAGHTPGTKHPPGALNNH